MGTITLEQVYYVGQTLAVVGVFISIIYLAAQLRQNTRAVRLSMVHAVVEEVREMYRVICEHREIAEIWLRGSQHPDQVSGVEKLQLYAFLHNWIYAYQNAYFQRMEGALSDTHWGGLTQMLIDRTDAPGMQQFWRDRKHWYSESFRDFMDSEIMPTPGDPAYRAAGT